MADIVDKATRSRMMAGIRGKTLARKFFSERGYMPLVFASGSTGRTCQVDQISFYPGTGRSYSSTVVSGTRTMDAETSVSRPRDPSFGPQN